MFTPREGRASPFYLTQRLSLHTPASLAHMSTATHELTAPIYTHLPYPLHMPCVHSAYHMNHIHLPLPILPTQCPLTEHPGVHLSHTSTHHTPSLPTCITLLPHPYSHTTQIHQTISHLVCIHLTYIHPTYPPPAPRPRPHSSPQHPHTSIYSAHSISRCPDSTVCVT